METDETSETVFFKCRLFLGLGGAASPFSGSNWGKVWQIATLSQIGTEGRNRTGKTSLLGVFSLLNLDDFRSRDAAAGDMWIPLGY